MPSVFQENQVLLDFEREFRSILLAQGGVLFGRLLQDRIDQIDVEFQSKADQQWIGRRSISLETLFGSVSIQRDYYYNGDMGHCPADAALGFEGGQTPALARLVCRAAAKQPYGAASVDLEEYGSIKIDERQVQRTALRIGPAVEPWLENLVENPKKMPVLYVSCDGTGAPMRKAELEGRKGKQPDGKAKTREIKLGAVFTQHTRDKKGRPIRDHDSTTYVGSFKSAHDFAADLLLEARRRSLGLAEQVVFLSDGAVWTEEVQRQNFPNSASILDFYHAAERVHDLAKAVSEEDDAAKKQAGKWIKNLLNDEVESVIDQASTQLPENPEKRQAAQEQLNFMKNHQQRMLYGTYRKNGWFIGSGVVEAGCRTVVGKRLKQSGMFWSEFGATCVLSLRTILLSRRFDAFWTDRHNQSAARNDVLALDA